MATARERRRRLPNSAMRKRAFMDSKRTKPSAGKDGGKVIGPVRQPQRDPITRVHAPLP